MAALDFSRFRGFKHPQKAIAFFNRKYVGIPDVTFVFGVLDAGAPQLGLSRLRHSPQPPSACACDDRRSRNVRVAQGHPPLRQRALRRQNADRVDVLPSTRTSHPGCNPPVGVQDLSGLACRFRQQCRGGRFLSGPPPFATGFGQVRNLPPREVRLLSVTPCPS